MRGLKADSVFIDEAKDFAPQGELPMLRASFKLNEVPMSIEEFSARLYENNKDFVANPNMYDRNTNERVTPAVGERSHVEQQAEEVRTRLPEPDVREPESR